MKNTVHAPAASTPRPTAYLLGLAAVIIFGATLPVTRLALEGFGPAFITFARALIAAFLAISGLALLNRPLRSRAPGQTFMSGFFLIFGFPGCMALAMQSVPAAQGGVVLGFLPLATALIARIITDERPSPGFWLLSALGCAIVTAFIFHKAGASTGAGDLSGYAWLVLPGVCAAAGYVMFGKLSRTAPGWEIIARALVYNFPLTLAGLALFWEGTVWQASATAVISLAYLGVFSMFLGFCAWNVALATGGIARIGQLQLLQVFVTLATAAILLAEKIDLLTVAAATAITIVIVLSRRA